MVNVKCKKGSGECDRKHRRSCTPGDDAHTDTYNQRLKGQVEVLLHFALQSHSPIVYGASLRVIGELGWHTSGIPSPRGED